MPKNFFELIKILFDTNHSTKDEVIWIEPGESHIECVMLSKIGPFEKWEVIIGKPMGCLRIFGSWFLKYKSENYRCLTPPM